MIGCIRVTGHRYTGSGLEGVNVWISKQTWEAAHLPLEGDKRLQVVLEIAGREYQGGIRATDDNPDIYISPDVEGPDKNLATIFDRLGWHKNDKLHVEVNGRRIRLVKVRRRGALPPVRL